MKNILTIIFSTAALVWITSCGGAKSSGSQEAEEASSASVSNGVEIEYSSIDALNAPAYDPDAEWGSPLALADGLTHTMNGFPIVEVGAYQDGDKMVYDIQLVNQSTDTVTVKSVKLPDNSMELNWRGTRSYPPGILSTFQLLSDSAVTCDDYRFILTYRDDKYPQQTFHLNLRPDVRKLIAEREAGMAAE